MAVVCGGPTLFGAFPKFYLVDTVTQHVELVVVFVFRFSVLDEIPKEVKDPVYDSGFWGETVDTRSTDESGELVNYHEESISDEEKICFLDESFLFSHRYM